MAFIIRRYFSSSSNSKKHFDVIVSGGGLIGTAVACLLARTPILSEQRVLLIEPSKPRQWSLGPKYSNRVSSINESTKQLMEFVGAWEHISNARFKEVMNMKVWDCSGAKVEFDSGVDRPVSYIVENDILVDAVERQLRDLPNVTVLNGSRVEQYTLPTDTDQLSELILSDGSCLSCSLLVGADGANSQVRKAMGVQYLSWRYNQTAVVATLQLSQVSSNDTAWQRFLQTGPIAILPLTNELSSLVWSTTPQQAKTLLQLSSDSFVDAINDSLRKEPVRSEAVNAVSAAARRVLGLVESPQHQQGQEIPLEPPHIQAVQDNSRAAFPLTFGHATSYVAPGVALVGDAAHKVHPLAGQGVNLGYGDVTCLVEQLTLSLQLGRSLGDVEGLKEYQRLRQCHNVPMMAAIDLMARVYSTQNPALLAIGNVALQVANSLPPVKSLMMSQAAS